MAATLRGLWKRRKLEPWLLQSLLKQHFAVTKVSVAANLLNALIVAFVFWNSGIRPAILAGAAVFFLIVWRRFSLAKAFEDASENEEALNKLRKQVEFNAFTMGSWWGVTVAILMTVASPSQALVLAILGAGKAAAGAITYRTMDRAAFFFVGSAAIGCAFALIWLGSFPAFASCFLLVTFVAVLFSNIHQTYGHIVDRLKREHEVAQSADTINMLLADFTEQGSDWLLELDAEGRLVNPSQRFAEAAQMPQQSLAGTELRRILRNGSEKHALLDHIFNKRAFRNQTVAVTTGKETSYWSISARPVVNDSKVAYRGVIRDITAQRQAEQRVTYMAHFDSLTGLPNRFQFQNQLSQTFGQRADITLLFLDLDEFKFVNDTMGHIAGDELLKLVADRLSDCLEEGEVAARLGGDEFAIIVPHASELRIDALSNDLIQSFAIPFILEEQDVTIGTSIGIAIAPQHGKDAATLLRNADLALYEAKANGRNQHAMFATGMDVAAQNRRALETDLKQALSQNQLRLHYQPLVEIETGEPSGYEALIRWEHPERGVIMPNDFIHIAEECGLIVQIGEWVIRQALDDMTQWPEDRSVSINLSPVQMRNPSLISTLVFALAKTGIAPNRVCLEITESVLMHDSEANLATLHKIKDLGIDIALDDFGTGYSSLNYLRSFPFDKIKIDRCFISEIDSREDCHAIVSSVLSLARDLGMKTTAEGVERSEQVGMLREGGCEEVQGWLYSKALPHEELSDLRRSTKSHPERLAHLESERRRLKKPDEEKTSLTQSLSEKFTTKRKRA